MEMTLHQKIAIRQPCFEAGECAKPEFGWRSLDPTVVLALTVNVGME